MFLKATSLKRMILKAAKESVFFRYKFVEVTKSSFPAWERANSTSTSKIESHRKHLLRDFGLVHVHIDFSFVMIHEKGSVKFMHASHPGHRFPS
jgi:hypothetical protein